MKTTAMLILLAGSVVPALGAAQDAASAGAALAKASRCYSCHSATEQLIGPPYAAIASRYSGDRSVMETVLARKILLGGGGNWGDVPMVPNEHVKPTDALKLARWVLNQAPARKN